MSAKRATLLTVAMLCMLVAIAIGMSAGSVDGQAAQDGYGISAHSE